MSFAFGDDGVLRFGPWTEVKWLVHGFSTRATGDFTPPGPADAGARFGAPGAQMITLRQTHSSLVRSATNLDEETEGDGLHTSRSGILIGVRTADCLPLLLLDRKRRHVAAVHAGWRGSSQKIASAAVDALEEAGSQPSDLEAVIGPCISAARYEVGAEVAERFEDEAIAVKPEWPRPHLDLAAANRLQLLESGVPPGSIQTSGLCTFERADRFHSHRRDRDRAGRMIAVIGIR